MNDKFQEAYNYHMAKAAMADDPKRAEYHEAFAGAIDASEEAREWFAAGAEFVSDTERCSRFEIRKFYGPEESTESFPLYYAKEDTPRPYPLGYGIYANLPDGTQMHVADFFNLETASECVASYESSVLLLDAAQARPILREYLVKLYRESEPTEELHVTRPDGQYVEIFPAYCDEGGLLQVITYDVPGGDFNDSQNMDKFRSKKRFFRNLDNQVDELLEMLGLLKWCIKNAYVDEFWKENGKTLTFSSKHLAQKYADSTQWAEGIEHDAKEAQVVIFEPVE